MKQIIITARVFSNPETFQDRVRILLTSVGQGLWEWELISKLDIEPSDLRTDIETEMASSGINGRLVFENF